MVLPNLWMVPNLTIFDKWILLHFPCQFQIIWLMRYKFVLNIYYCYQHSIIVTLRTFWQIENWYCRSTNCYLGIWFQFQIFIEKRKSTLRDSWVISKSTNMSIFKYCLFWQRLLLFTGLWNFPLLEFTLNMKFSFKTQIFTQIFKFQFLSIHLCMFVFLCSYISIHALLHLYV